jgi:hypothetical protein
MDTLALHTNGGALILRQAPGHAGFNRRLTMMLLASKTEDLRSAIRLRKGAWGYQGGCLPMI